MLSAQSGAVYNNPSIFVDNDLEQNLNCTDCVIKFCDLYTKHVLSEKWSRTWEIVILSTVANKLLFNPQLSEYIEKDDKDDIETFLKGTSLLLKDDFKKKVEYSFYSLFQIVLFQAETRNKMDAFINNINWLRLKQKLSSVLRNVPEMYFFLDSIDLEYEHAPAHWLMCQKGLFYALLAFLQEGKWGEKLHLIITLRDNVFTSILRSEHSTKFIHESHVLLLNWTHQNISYFLKQKIENLDDCYFLLAHDNEKTLKTWLSVDTIHNEFGDTERIDDFVLRHTRLVPRDIIIIGNELAKLHAELTSNPDLDVEHRIKEIILNNSKVIGGELLTICAKNITANSMPSGAGVYQYSEGFTTNQIYHESTYTKLIRIMPQLKAMVFERDLLECLEVDAKNAFGEDVFLVDVLWQNGVIGFVENNRPVFYAQGFNSDTLLPRDKKMYSIQSCVAWKLGLSQKFS